MVDSFPNARKRPHDAMAASQQPQQSTDVTLAWELLRVVAQQNEENQSNSNNNNNAMANGPSQNAFASLIGQQSQQQVGNVETRSEGNGPLGTTADAGAGLVGSNMAGPQEQQQQAVTASAAAVANEGGAATGGGAVPLWSHQPVINCLAVMLLLQRLEQLQSELTEQTSQYNNLANILFGIQENLGQNPVMRGGNNGAVAATGGVNVNSDTNTSNAYESPNRGIQCNANGNATDTTASASALNNNIHFSPATTSMDMVIQASQQQDPSAMLTALVAEIALTSQKQRQQQRMIGSLQEQIDTLRRPAPVAAQQQEQQRQLQEQHPNLHPLLQRLIQMQPPSNSQQQQQPSSQPQPPTRPQQSHVHSLIQFILEEQQRQQQFQQEPSLQVNGLAAHFASQQQQAIEDQQKGINGDDGRNRNNDIMDDPDGISVAASVNNAMPKVPLFINVPRNPWKRHKNQYSHRRQRRSANDRLRQQHGGPPVAHVVPPTRSTSSNVSTASADVAVPYPSTATRTLHAAEASTSNKDRDVLVTAASLIQLHASSTDGSPGETDGSSGEDSPGSNSSNDDSPLTGVGNSGSSSDEAHDTNTTDEDNDEKHQKRELQRYSPSSLSNDAYKKVLAASKERRDADGDKDDDETKIIMPPPRLDMEMVSSLQDAASSASSASSLSMESTVDLVILD